MTTTPPKTDFVRDLSDKFGDAIISAFSDYISTLRGRVFPDEKHPAVGYLEAIKWDVLHEINSVLRDYAPLNAKSNPRETFTHLEKENSMYLIEFSESHRWHNWDWDDSGHPLVYSSIAEARLALYEDHLEALLDEDVDAADNMPLDRFSIVREEGDEPAVRWCLTETGTLCKPIPY